MFGDRPAGLAETMNTPGADESVSHATLETADAVNVPPPEFEIVMDWAGGRALPATYENLSCVIESDRVGGAVTVSVTDTVCGLFDAPAAVIVIAP